MFNWRREKKKQREFETLFRSYLPEPVLSMLNFGEDASLGTKDVDLVFVLVECAELSRFSSLMSLAIRLGEEKKVALLANAGGLLQFAVGPRIDSTDAVQLRNTFASETSNALGTHARIGVGRLKCHVGVLGTTGRKTWGCHPVEMAKALKRLLDAVPGTTVQLDPS